MFISIEDMPSFIKYLDDYINNTITNPIFTWSVPFRYYPLSTRMDKFEVTKLDSFKITITPGVDICGNKATIAVDFAFSEKESVIKFRNFCMNIITEYDIHATEAEWNRLHKAELAGIEKDLISNHKWDIIPHDKIVYISSSNEDLI